MSEPRPPKDARPELSLAGAIAYAPAPETFPVSIADRYGHFIGGEIVEGSEPFATLNPATGAVLTHFPTAGQAEIDAAVAAAHKALSGPWGRMSGLERGKVLFRIARRMAERARELAVLETLDNGKPIRETRDIDVPQAAQHFFYYAGWADKLEHAVHGRPRPVGVCAQVIPWNFPLLMLAWKIAPALAAGNTVVLKPAETTPLTAAFFADICREVGVPAGVVNLVYGAGATGAALVAHPDVQKVAFTGSTGVGQRIMRSIAGSGKKATMELGGKGAHIVFDDAALDGAVEGVVTGIFTNQGHVCCAGSRLLLQESIAEDFLARLKRRILTLRVGDPLDKNTDVGAVNSAAQLGRIQAYVARGAEEGGEVWQGAATAAPTTGCFHLPTLITGVQQTDTVAREEIFGPVLAVLTFRTPEEALSKANDTEYGLAAGLWTEKTSKAFQVAHALNAGLVYVNGYNLFDPASPFGGLRHSGFGREGGVHGLWPYVEVA
jgi:aldehyde dehydrogenase (NAD+)